MCDGPCNFSSNRLLVSLLAKPRGVKLAEGWKMAGALGLCIDLGSEVWYIVS